MYKLSSIFSFFSSFFFKRGHTPTKEMWQIYAIFSIPTSLEAKNHVFSLPRAKMQAHDLALPIRCAYVTLTPRKGELYELYFLVRVAASLFYLGSNSGRWSGSEAPVLSVMGSTSSGSHWYSEGLTLWPQILSWLPRPTSMPDSLARLLISFYKFLPKLNWLVGVGVGVLTI